MNNGTPASLWDQNLFAGVRHLFRKALAEAGIYMTRGETAETLASISRRVCAPVEDMCDWWMERSLVKYGLTTIERDLMKKQAQVALEMFRRDDA